MILRSMIAGLLLVPAGGLAAAGEETSELEFFQRHVATIFERHCLACHQDQEAKGGLSLSTRQAALQGGESGPVIVPGKAEQSLLLEHISGDQPEMPKNRDPLTKQQVETIRRWIAEGAAWSEDLKLVDKRNSGPWWSLEPVVKPPVPDYTPWARTPIDAFIAAKQRELGLAPSPEADRRTLIRRLTFDLHGLPSEPHEVERFVADPAPDAYERLIDRLLASPRYGERWGRHWLDVVHYGESHGYDKDKPRLNAWPYRDYVIRSFNQDKPYSRFVQEQLAGDVLFPDDPDAVVATGFIVAGPWDFVGHVELREGTVDKRIARSNDRDDMLANAMSTFTSLTVHCARCHDHKFDPVTQADYYRLQAVFAGVDRADRPYDADAATLARRRRLTAELAALEARHASIKAEMDKTVSPQLARLDQRISELEAQLTALPDPAADKPGSPTNGYHSAIMSQPDAEKWVQVDLGRSVPIETVRLVPARPTDFPDSPGFGFPLRYRVDISDDPQFATRATLADHTASDVMNPGDVPVEIPAGGRAARYVRVTATRLWKRRGDFVFALAELEAASAGANVARSATVTSLDSIEAGRWSRKHLVDGYDSRARLGDSPTDVAGQRMKVQEALAGNRRERQQLLESLLEPPLRAQWQHVVAQLANSKQQLAALPPQQVAFLATGPFKPQGQFKPVAGPRPVHLLRRGDVKSEGPLMPPGALACLAHLGLEAEFALPGVNGEGARRAALARWIIDPRHPLTRRSIVNRVWHYHFGQGLVDTPNDFGRMGSLPSHPELLDWLAAEFYEHGESLKRLHRLILTSSVWRQSSQSNAALETLDSGNRFLWRMQRSRLDAESLRDAVLATSGKLDLEMGGPSLQQFYFKDDHSPVYDYTRFDIDQPAAYRRSVYRFLVRSVPDPLMESFDCADPSISTPRRNTTLTALQALSLLNHPFLVRQAEHFAARLRSQTPDPAAQIELAYRLALARSPALAERRLMIEHARRHGLENVCRLIFNSNEYLFID
jgi:mono/diheme cytochrome c family protein